MTYPEPPVPSLRGEALGSGATPPGSQLEGTRVRLLLPSSPDDQQQALALKRQLRSLGATVVEDGSMGTDVVVAVRACEPGFLVRRTAWEGAAAHGGKCMPEAASGAWQRLECMGPA